MSEKTPAVEHLNMSLRPLARADFKSLHQQRATSDETIWSLLKYATRFSNAMDSDEPNPFPFPFPFPTEPTPSKAAIGGHLNQ